MLERTRVKDDTWQHKFYPITPYLSVSCALVFLGDAAEQTKDIGWHEYHIHYEGPRKSPEGKDLDTTTKLYLAGGQAIRHRTISESVFDSIYTLNFDLETLDAHLERYGVCESFVHWQFLRRNARIACARESEQYVMWGFGRPHPFKPHFKPDQRFAGPLVDYRNGLNPEGNVAFKETWMKGKPDDGSDEFYYVIESDWYDGLSVNLIEITRGIPEKVRDYEFPQKYSGHNKDNAFTRDFLGSLQHGQSR